MFPQLPRSSLAPTLRRWSVWRSLRVPARGVMCHSRRRPALWTRSVRHCSDAGALEREKLPSDGALCRSSFKPRLSSGGRRPSRLEAAPTAQLNGIAPRPGARSAGVTAVGRPRYGRGASALREIWDLAGDGGGDQRRTILHQKGNAVLHQVATPGNLLLVVVYIPNRYDSSVFNNCLRSRSCQSTTSVADADAHRVRRRTLCTRLCSRRKSRRIGCKGLGA